MVGIQYGGAIILTIVIVCGTRNGKGDVQQWTEEWKYILTTYLSGR